MTPAQERKAARLIRIHIDLIEQGKLQTIDIDSIAHLSGAPRGEIDQLARVVTLEAAAGLKHHVQPGEPMRTRPVPDPRRTHKGEVDA